MSKTQDIDPSIIQMIEDTVENVFRVRLKCTKEEHEILLLKAYTNVLPGCTITRIDKEVPEDEIDHYKQYDKKCRVVCKNQLGHEFNFYMSYHSSGRESARYWKYKYINATRLIKLLTDRENDLTVALERQTNR